MMHALGTENAKMQFWKTHNFAYSKVIGTFVMLLGMALSSGMTARAAEGNASAATRQEPPPIQVIPGDGINLEIAEQISSHYVVVKVNPPVHNWFAGTFTNLPTDGTVCLGLSMADCSTGSIKSDVSKWSGLRPMMTYANPSDYASYEWFFKDSQGRWVSGDALKTNITKYAGKGKVPKQSVIPDDVAEQFLSDDGRYWSPWREVDSTDAIPSLNIFRIKLEAKHTTVTIAMRVPFTYSYLQQYIARLNSIQRTVKLSVDTIGETGNRNKLQVIRIEPQEACNTVTASGVLPLRGGKIIPNIFFNTPVNKKKYIVVYAREHGTESDGSWVIKGMIDYLVSGNGIAKDLYSNYSWLFIPIMDPDAAQKSIYESLCNEFCYRQDNAVPIEVVEYLSYYRAFANDGIPIVGIITMHNVECNEASNVWIPFCEYGDKTIAASFGEELAKALKNEGNYSANLNSFVELLSSNRLGGWHEAHYGSFVLPVEVNSRHPGNRLDIKSVEAIGPCLMMAMSAVISAPQGGERCAACLSRLDLRNTSNGAISNSVPASLRDILHGL